MKIELELPDWCDERAIYIMAGIELAAYKIPDQDWKLKISRCNMCGKCCMKLGKRHPFPTVDGTCIYLEREPGSRSMWRCKLGMSRPFGCCVGTPRNMPECTERYEDIML